MKVHASADLAGYCHRYNRYNRENPNPCLSGGGPVCGGAVPGFVVESLSPLWKFSLPFWVGDLGSDACFLSL